MADENKPIGVDATGYEVLTKAVAELLNSYPLLNGDVITFEKLEESGIAFSASSGALVMSEIRDVVGGVFQNCQFPFFIVYRTSGNKVKAQTFLDEIGKWICKEPNGKDIATAVYPESVMIRSMDRSKKYEG